MITTQAWLRLADVCCKVITQVVSDHKIAIGCRLLVFDQRGLFYDGPVPVERVA